MTNREERSWVSSFCSRRENQYFCEVEDSFINDSFNLYGINSEFHLYKQALSIILGEYTSEASNGGCLKAASQIAEIDEAELENTANYVYGMIHARYILTTPGIEAMVLTSSVCEM